jgi:hypothetical protein
VSRSSGFGSCETSGPRVLSAFGAIEPDGLSGDVWIDRPADLGQVFDARIAHPRRIARHESLVAEAEVRQAGVPATNAIVSSELLADGGGRRVAADRSS